MPDGVLKSCQNTCSVESNHQEFAGLQSWRNPSAGSSFVGLTVETQVSCRVEGWLDASFSKPMVQFRFLGSEWRYVIMSTVRSCPRAEIDRKPTKSWQKKYLGFVTDPNQVNVGITRAQEGLCILGGSPGSERRPAGKQGASVRHRCPGQGAGTGGSSGPFHPKPFYGKGVEVQTSTSDGLALFF